MNDKKGYTTRTALALGAGVLVAAAIAVPAIAGRGRTAVPDKTAATETARQEGGAVAGRPWANSTQFMEIQSGQVRGGRVYLKVRPAEKRILGESFETVPVPGPYTEVTVIQNARILHLDGESGTAEAFVLDLSKRNPNRPNHVTPDQRQEGFDLTFDGQGRVTQIDWLYVP